jgi:hypothetical protein
MSDALEELISEVEALCDDDGQVVREAVQLAREQPLPPADVERLFTRILTILRTAGKDMTDEERTSVAVEIRAETAALMAERNVALYSESGDGDDLVVHGGLTFHARYGLRPRAVLPVPTFNGQPVLLTEGYVEVSRLMLWKDNHRVQLHVQEFREVNHRDPDEHELLLLMHGALPLPSLHKDDPFKLRGLADSISRKGVERPPIVTWDGEPKDGNRRIAASLLVLSDTKYTLEQKERARWIRVWQAPEGTTPDQFEAIVVALNFEPDHKEDWPEYVKARLVVDRYRSLKEDYRGAWSQTRDLELRKRVAEQFAIEHREVKRYLEMVQWAEDFEEYQTAERGLDPARVRYKANDIFQWFYEIQAGRGQDKLTARIQQDDTLRMIVYDLMYDVLDSGAQLRNLHKVVVDDAALDLLRKAHDEHKAERAVAFVDAAIAEALKNSPTRRLGFDQFLRTAVDRLGSAPPEQWRDIDVTLLNDLRRVFHASIGAIEGALAVRNSGQ